MQGVYAQLLPDCLFDELAPFTFTRFGIHCLNQIIRQIYMSSQFWEPPYRLITYIIHMVRAHDVCDYLPATFSPAKTLAAVTGRSVILTPTAS